MPMLIIKLYFEKNKEPADQVKKKKTSKKEKEGKSDFQEHNIRYYPSLDKCTDLFKRALKKIVDSTNHINNLETNLMPFMKFDDRPNFPIDMTNPWIVEADKEITQMCQENIVYPTELLNSYKKYEHLLNVDRKKLIQELFDGEEKKPLDEIRELVKLYDVSEQEINNLSNDTIDSTLFRIEVGEIKQ